MLIDDPKLINDDQVESFILLETYKSSTPYDPYESVDIIIDFLSTEIEPDSILELDL